MFIMDFESQTKKKTHLSSFQIIVFGFAAVILLGAALLMLPFSTHDGEGASFADAVFTATSAVCVTGLVIHDTAQYWAVFGQSVIILLIQIGGIGVVTIAVVVAMASGRKIGLMQRSTIQEAIAAPRMSGVVRLTGFIVKATLAVELIGAAVMAPVFCSDFGFPKGLWLALFHSVSAFCNAGFDLMGADAAYSSLTAYCANPVISIAIPALIITGGIGFLTWDDIRTNRLRLSHYRMQSKVILATTALLILAPALYMYFVEFSGDAWDYMTVSEKLLASFFQSVTPRTAGFNTVDLTALSESGQTLLIALMLIGGSPGSTAGGMKTTTFAVLLLAAVSVFRKREHAQCFGRRISPETVKHAAVLFMLYILLPLIGAFILSIAEELPMLSCLFETASAIGTVGLSLGMTPHLGMLSRGVLVALMFFGRVGGLTLVFAVMPGMRENLSKLPLEKITVG